MDNEHRLAELERRLAALEKLVQAHPESARATPPPQSTAPAATPRAAEPRRDWEALIGRYGTLILATVAILAAVGTFIAWAIANGLLGPTTRVVLGLIASAAMAVGGLRLRQRERTFGTSLLGIALAMAHVCAWGAGPYLHIVPSGVAFALAAVASAAIAILAHAEDDQPLWCVGFIGAAIAPFVTSTQSGQMLLLALYGLGVLATAGRALGMREWRVAGRVFAMAATLYVVALMMGTERDNGPRLAMGLPLALAFLGVLPWTDGEVRRDRLRPLGALAGLAALRNAFSGGVAADRRFEAMLIGAAGLSWLILVDQTRPLPAAESSVKRNPESDWVDAGLVPAAFVFASLAALDATARVNGLIMVGVTLALFFAMSRHPAGSRRDAAAAVTVVSAVAAAALLQQGNALGFASSVALVGVMCFAADLWRESGAWSVLGTITFGMAMLVTLVALNDRVAFGYTPFSSTESAVSLLVFAALLGAWRIARQPKMKEVLIGGVVVWGFTWVHQEIAFAFNRTAATLLRVFYYAATSVAAVWVGRARHVAILRHAGLGLAILAAGTALYSARNLVIGARIGADLVAAAFLLAIAYWYRKPGTSTPVASEPEVRGQQRPA